MKKFPAWIPSPTSPHMTVTPTSNSIVSRVCTMARMQISPVTPHLPGAPLPCWMQYLGKNSPRCVLRSPQCVFVPRPPLPAADPAFLIHDSLLSNSGQLFHRLPHILHLPECFLGNWLRSATSSLNATWVMWWTNGSTTAGGTQVSLFCSLSPKFGHFVRRGPPNLSIKRVPLSWVVNKSMRWYFCFMWMTPFSNHHQQSLPDWMNTARTPKLYFPTSIIIPTFARCRFPAKTNYSFKKSFVSSPFNFLVLLQTGGCLKINSMCHKLWLSVFFLVLGVFQGGPFQSGFCSLGNDPIGFGAGPCFVIQDALGSPRAFWCIFKADMGNPCLMNKVTKIKYFLPDFQLSQWPRGDKL